MNKIALVLVVIAAFCLAQQEIPHNNSYEKPKMMAGKYCKRTTDVNFSNGNKVIVITAKAACATATREENKKRGAAAEIRFSMTSIGLARMRLEGRKRTADKDAGFRIGFAVDRMIEFVDPNNSGYSPDKQIVNEINFINKPGNPKMQTWSVISHTPTTVGDVTVHEIVATGTHDDAKIKIGVTFATAEVTVTTANQTVSRTVLRPNSFKLNLVANDIVYKQANTRIAIGAVLVTKRAAKQRPTSRSIVQSQDGEDVADNTATQSVVDVEDEDASSTENGGFFSFKRFVFGRANATAAIQQYSLVVTPLGPNNSSDVPDDAQEGFGGYTTRRLFVTPQGRPTQIVWDPAAGTNEDQASSANTASSVSVMVFAIVFSLLAFLY